MRRISFLSAVFLCACGSPIGVVPGDAALPSAACMAMGGSAVVQAPMMPMALSGNTEESWLGSPAVADLDGDGTAEIVVTRERAVMIWHADGSLVRRLTVASGRIWAPPVVGDLTGARPGLEIAVAADASIYVWDAAGNALAGFPTRLHEELRSLAAGDINGDGALDLVSAATDRIEASGQRDFVYAVQTNGGRVAGFPPNTTGAGGCDDNCDVTGGFDQNIALGDLGGSGAFEIFAPQDNAYVSVHDGTGRMFDCDRTVFSRCTKIAAVRFLHDLNEARQGYSEHESTSLQAHFTNSAPAIADVDGDGRRELVVLASVQNANQSNRHLGVALWVFRPNGTRLSAWTRPFRVATYLSGLTDFDGTNIVGATNQVSVVDLDPGRMGPEFVFAGFDGAIHVVDAQAQEIWAFPYTSDPRVLTGGVAVADLSRDGVPEIVFTTFSPDPNKSKLFVIGANGAALHRVDLPGRGAMAVPTIADVNHDGTLEIAVNLKDGVSSMSAPIALVYGVPGSGTNCMPWPTGRGNLLRNGYVR